MKMLTLKIPDNIDLNAREIHRFLAAKLFEVGKLSLGQAAEMAGLSKIAFSEILADYQVSLINYSAAEIEQDVQRF